MGTSVIPSSGASYQQVDTYNDLPLASSDVGAIYVVLNSIVDHPSGFYYSTGSIWYFLCDVSGGVPSNTNWGSIGGILSNQLDLITALNLKLDKSELIPQSITLNRDENGNIESIEYTSKPTLNIIRDVNGDITSYNNGIYNWVINKTDGIITGITVTTI